MIQIICGEDNVASRNHFLGLIDGYKKEGFSTHRITPSSLSEINSASETNLFGLRNIYIVENINKTIKKTSTQIQNLLEQIDKNKEVNLVVWEDGISQRDLKIKVGKVKEFRPENNIFKLLDACYPSNLRNFLLGLDSIANAQNEIFILTMIQRHLRNLLLIKSGNIPPSLQSWQAGKLKRQASAWEQSRLTSFYDGLYRIDASLKTGKNPHGIKRSLDILACYFL